MLSILPQLFAFQLLGLFILRAILGLIFLTQGYLKIFKDENRARPKTKLTGIAETVTGFLFLTGFLTQLAALSAIALILTSMLKTGFNEPIRQKGWSFGLLILAASLAILLSGAGILAIDLPL